MGRSATVLLILVTYLLLPSAALAELFHVYVSYENGADTAGCGNYATPCASISRAVTEVTDKGTVFVRAGRYGPFTVTKSVDVIAVTDEVLLATGSNVLCPDLIAAICINAPNAVVRLRGIVMDRVFETAPGVKFFAGAALHLEGMTIIDANDTFALQFVPSAGVSELYISDSVISDNRTGTGSGGILIRPTGAASVTAVLDNVHIENNGTGLKVDGTGNTGGAIKVDLVDSVISGNTAQGVFADSPANGAPVDVTIRNSTITGNGHAGVLARGKAASGRGSVIVRFGGSSISKNGAGVLAYDAGIVRSLGGNFVDANGSGNGPFTIISPE